MEVLRTDQGWLSTFHPIILKGASGGLGIPSPSGQVHPGRKRGDSSLQSHPSAIQGGGEQLQCEVTHKGKLAFPTQEHATYPLTCYPKSQLGGTWKSFPVPRVNSLQPLSKLLALDVLHVLETMSSRAGGCFGNLRVWAAQRCFNGGVYTLLYNLIPTSACGACILLLICPLPCPGMFLSSFWHVSQTSFLVGLHLYLLLPCPHPSRVSAFIPGLS